MVVLLVLLTQPLLAQVQISEFMASNSRTLADDFGEYSDWIEIWNSSPATVDLLDWALTDEPGDTTKWRFPSTNVPPNSYLVVFASNRDRRTPGQTLHTNFKLDASGEYLALRRPDGTIASEFSTPYPAQLPDISFGAGLETATLSLVTTGSMGRVLVPGDGSLGLAWTAAGFIDSSWRAVTNGLGFETGQSEDPGSVPAEIVADNPPGYWRLAESSASPALNAGWLGAAGDGLFIGGVVTGAPGPRPSAWAGFETTNVAARFNGSGAKVEVPFTPDLNPSAAFTIEAWVKPSRLGTAVACPVSSLTVTGSSRAGYVLYQNYSDAPGQWEFKLGNSAGYIASAHGGTLSTNTWQYLAGVYDGSAARLYLNGSLVGSASLSGAFEPNTIEKFVIGGRINSSNPYYFAGDIDEVAVHSRALSAGEIATRYQVATTGVSPTNFNYTGLFKTDLAAAMYGVNSSVYFRLPFALASPQDLTSLRLKVRYDDGFVAFLNGTPVISDNAPETLSWNSCATNRRPAAAAQQLRVFDLSDAIGYLQPGTNLLALQGLNAAATNPDFLLHAQLEATFLRAADQPRYFTQPTPGGPNVLGTADLGPLLTGEGFSPSLPGTNDSITVTCRVAAAFAPVSAVTLNWRVMYNAVQQNPMFDDGLHGDGAAGDGIYGAIISNRVGIAWAYTAGQMVRWFVTASDSLSRTSRWPLFTDPLASAEYDGTVVQPDYVTSQLPVFHLFVNPASFSGMDSETGARGSFYYDGEFYDNMYIERRGNTTAAYAKKSHRLEFNHEHQLRHPGPGDRLSKTSLLAEFADPAYVRQHLSFWLMALAGVPSPFHYPVRLQRNGAFYQLAFHSDVLGPEQLRRLGYDDQGALYKAAGTITTAHSSTGGFQKLLPKTNLTSTVDFDAMATAISETRTAGQRRTNVFEVLNLPEIINYLAVARWTQEGDDLWANMSVYRDTFGTGEWSIIPFDLNVSWGQLYYADRPADYSYINSTNDFLKSHPLYGGSQIQEAGSRAWNRIYDIIIAVPETRQMLLRRLRTIMDRFVQPPGTPAAGAVIEQHIFAMTNLFWAEAHLDRQLWGWPPNSGMYGFGPNQWLTNGVNDLIEQFLGPRRLHFFVTHCITNTSKPVGLTWSNNAGIPVSQPLLPSLRFAALEYSPVSGNQDQEYLCLTNPGALAVDISGWKLQGGIAHEFRPGTVIPAGGSLYVSPNVAAFRARSTGPRGGLGLFVQGNYSGHLNAWGDALALTDSSGHSIAGTNYTGSPSPAQRYLRITEIMYNPPALPGDTADAQQFEYLELKNISTTVTLNLNGVRFTNGIFFNFSGSVITSLAPGQTTLVVRNPVAFAARYGGGFSIAGQYAGALDNAGETVRLEDAAGEKILEFAYDNRWYPTTDGLGFSLVIVDANAPWNTWGLKASWRPSAQLRGSPGITDPAPRWLPPVLVNEALTHSDPANDWIELFNPAATNVDIGGWFLTDDVTAPKKYRIANGTFVPPMGYIVFPGAATFEAGTNGFRLSEYGEQVFLFSGDATTNLTGYSHGFDFGAAPNGISFGRYLTSQGEEQFVLQGAATPGTNNAVPRVGPVVISEVMYHPIDMTGLEDPALEFIELQNLATTNVPLYCTFTNEPGYGAAAATNAWRLRKGVDFDFPPWLALTAGGRLLVVGFDPSRNAAQLTAFRNFYQVAAEVPIVGPWQGRLENAGETIELQAPDKPDVTSSNIFVPYVLIDKLSYQPAWPWPAEADGTGASLQRALLAAYGNDPTNWLADLPSAGQLSSWYARPELAITYRYGAPVTISVLSSPVLSYQLEYKINLADPTWTQVPPARVGNGAALILSDPAPLTARRFYRVRAQ